jgi:hypothetical protein
MLRSHGDLIRMWRRPLQRFAGSVAQRPEPTSVPMSGVAVANYESQDASEPRVLLPETVDNPAPRTGRVRRAARIPADQEQSVCWHHSCTELMHPGDRLVKLSFDTLRRATPRVKICGLYGYERSGFPSIKQSAGRRELLQINVD